MVIRNIVKNRARRNINESISRNKNVLLGPDAAGTRCARCNAQGARVAPSKIVVRIVGSRRSNQGCQFPVELQIRISAGKRMRMLKPTDRQQGTLPFIRIMRTTAVEAQSEIGEMHETLFWPNTSNSATAPDGARETFDQLGLRWHLVRPRVRQ